MTQCTQATSHLCTSQHSCITFVTHAFGITGCLGVFASSFLRRPTKRVETTRTHTHTNTRNKNTYYTHTHILNRSWKKSCWTPTLFAGSGTKPFNQTKHQRTPTRKTCFQHNFNPALFNPREKRFFPAGSNSRPETRFSGLLQELPQLGHALLEGHRAADLQELAPEAFDFRSRKPREINPLSRPHTCLESGPRKANNSLSLSLSLYVYAYISWAVLRSPAKSSTTFSWLNTEIQRLNTKKPRNWRGNLK